MAARTSQRGSTLRVSRTEAGGRRPRYIVDDEGKRLEVVLPISVGERADIRGAQIARHEGKWESLAEVKRRLGL